MSDPNVQFSSVKKVQLGLIVMLCWWVDGHRSRRSLVLHVCTCVSMCKRIKTYIVLANVKLGLKEASPMRYNYDGRDLTWFFQPHHVRTKIPLNLHSQFRKNFEAMKNHKVWQAGRECWYQICSYSQIIIVIMPVSLWVLCCILVMLFALQHNSTHRVLFRSLRTNHYGMALLQQHHRVV